MSTVRLAVVGAGRLAELGYLPAVAACPDAEVVAVVDPEPGRLAAVGRRVPDAIGAPTLSEVLSRIGLDGVVVASPAPTHLAVAAEAAAAGLATLVEKPPAPDAAGARELAALTPTPWVGFNRRFDPGALRAREAARAALAPVSVTVELHYRHRSWAPVAVDDDVLGDLAPHAVDWVRWVSGSEPTTVRADASHRRAQIHLDLDSGGRGVIRLSSDRIHTERLRVVDAHGRAVADHRLGGPVAMVTGRLSRRAHPLVTTLSEQVAAFVNAIRDRPAPRLGRVEDGVAVMSVIDAARASVAAGGAPRPVTRIPA